MMLPDVLHLCPVDGCQWQFNPDLLPPPRVVVPADTNLSNAIDATVSRLVSDSAARTEKILREHLESHDVVDFARTIRHLRQQLAQAGTVPWCRGSTPVPQTGGTGSSPVGTTYTAR